MVERAAAVITYTWSKSCSEAMTLMTLENSNACRRLGSVT